MQTEHGQAEVTTSRGDTASRVENKVSRGEHRTPGGREVQRSQPTEGTRPAEQRTRSAKVSKEHPTEH